MSMSIKQRQKARQLYIENETAASIASEIGVSVATIYNWKSSDAKNGVNWDKLKTVQGNYRLETLSQSLLAQILDAFNLLNDQLSKTDLDVIQKVDVLAKAADAFNKSVNSANKLAPEANKLAVINGFIEYLADELPPDVLADVISASESVIAKHYAK